MSRVLPGDLVQTHRLGRAGRAGLHKIARARIEAA